MPFRAMWRYLGFRGEIISRASRETLNPVGSLLWELKGFIKFFWYIFFGRYNETRYPPQDTGLFFISSTHDLCFHLSDLRHL